MPPYKGNIANKIGSKMIFDALNNTNYGINTFALLYSQQFCIVPRNDSCQP